MFFQNTINSMLITWKSHLKLIEVFSSLKNCAKKFKSVHGMVDVLAKLLTDGDKLEWNRNVDKPTEWVLDRKRWKEEQMQHWRR